MGCDAAEVATIVTAIGNHDEGTSVPVNTVAAAMILADKADVRRSRVRNTDISKFDIHDRINYSVKKSTLKINEEKTIVKLKLRDYEEKSVNKIFYDNDRRKTGMKSAFRLCFIYNSYKIACQERAGNPPVFLTFFIILVSVPHT